MNFSFDFKEISPIHKNPRMRSMCMCLCIVLCDQFMNSSRHILNYGLYKKLHVLLYHRRRKTLENNWKYLSEMNSVKLRKSLRVSSTTWLLKCYSIIIKLYSFRKIKWTNNLEPFWRLLIKFLPLICPNVR